MLRLFTFLLSILLTGGMFAQIQQGYVKTKGRMDASGTIIPGVRLEGVAISVKNRNAVVSDKDGTFTIKLQSPKYYLTNVQKQGYVITDMDILSREYNFSADNPHVVVVELYESQSDDKLQIERRLRRTLQKQLQQREEEIDSLKATNAITQEEYRKLVQELYEDEEKNQQLIEDMVERYAKIDYDQLDEFNRQISQYILNGELQKADSLLNTKGDIHQRIRDLRKQEDINSQEEAELTLRQDNLSQSKLFAQKQKEDLSQDCYNKFELFKLQHVNDSALYYLELRASLDTSNITWLDECGDFSKEYIADYTKAMNYYTRALAIAENTKNETHIAKLYNALAVVYGVLDRDAEAIAYFHKSLHIHKKMFGNTSPQVANVMGNIGAVYYQRRDDKNALEWFSKEFDILYKVYGANHIEIAHSYKRLGNVYANQKDYEKALEYNVHALDIRQQFLDAQHLDIARSYNDIATVYADMKDYEKALEFQIKALAIEKSLVGEEHPITATTYSNMGFYYAKLKEYDKALDYYDKALKLRKNILGEKHSKYAEILYNIADLYKILNKYSLAIDNYKAAIAIWQALYGEDYSLIGTAYNQLAMIAYTQKDYETALQYFDKSLILAEKQYGENHSQTAVTINNIVQTCYKMKDYSKALGYNIRYATIMENLYGVVSSQIAEAWVDLGLNKYYVGDSKEAIHDIQKAFKVYQKNQDFKQLNQCCGLLLQISIATNDTNLFQDVKSQIMYVATIANGENPATLQGMSGWYYMLEFADWTLETPQLLETVVRQYQGKPKEIVVLKDGQITQHYFENSIGANFNFEYVSKEKKKELIAIYKKWKHQSKKNN